MRDLVQFGELKSRLLARPRAKQTAEENAHSARSVMRHLGRVILGWLTIIIAIQLAVKHFGWS